MPENCEFIGADWPDAWEELLKAMPKAKRANTVTAAMFVEAVHYECIELLKTVRPRLNGDSTDPTYAALMGRIDSLIS